MAYAATGGLLGGLLALAVLAAAAALGGTPAVAAPNAIGAWLVRWLQAAAPDALESFYYDATLLGIASAMVFGIAAAAVFGGIMVRLPEDHPAAWGLLLGAACWAVTRFALAPALDPLVLRVFDWRALLPAFLAFGLFVGLWVQTGRGLSTLPAGQGP